MVNWYPQSRCRSSFCSAYFCAQNLLKIVSCKRLTSLQCGLSFDPQRKQVRNKNILPRYSSRLMEHFQTPRNAGALEKYDGVGEASLDGRAPRMKIYVALEKGLISQAGFETFGCGVSIACGSALTEMALGRAPTECLKITTSELSEALGGVPQEKQFCADLAIRALHAALSHHLSQQ
jgi:nitrogen fixation protein NifU and related proteins